jgi:hypothetical protein
MNNPARMALDSSGDLWIVDTVNNRVLEFTCTAADSCVNGNDAALVLGQSSFLTNTEGLSATGMYNPEGIAVDSAGNVWVADYTNSRVLEFKPPFSNGMAASLVLGQSSFTSNSPATTRTGMSWPTDVIENSGNIWITEGKNNRVLEFVPPFSNGMAASLVLGQSSFTTNSPATTRTGMWYPAGIIVANHNVWVAEANNNRVLEFLATSAPITATSNASGSNMITTILQTAITQSDDNAIRNLLNPERP